LLDLISVERLQERVVGGDDVQLGHTSAIVNYSEEKMIRKCFEVYAPEIALRLERNNARAMVDLQVLRSDVNLKCEFEGNRGFLPVCIMRTESDHRQRKQTCGGVFLLTSYEFRNQ